MSGVSRRAALGLLLAAAPFAASAKASRAWPGAGVSVDVSPLRRAGDDTDADFLEAVLPGYIRQSAGRDIAVRIDSVTYGPPGSAGGSSNTRALDTIEGVGLVSGRSVPLQCSLIAEVSLPDVGGYAARMRQDQLARSFAQWLPRQIG